jgi:hypothetical protein
MLKHKVYFDCRIISNRNNFTSEILRDVIHPFFVGEYTYTSIIYYHNGQNGPTDCFQKNLFSKGNAIIDAGQEIFKFPKHFYVAFVPHPTRGDEMVYTFLDYTDYDTFLPDLFHEIKVLSNDGFSEMYINFIEDFQF